MCTGLPYGGHTGYYENDAIGHYPVAQNAYDEGYGLLRVSYFLSPLNLSKFLVYWNLKEMKKMLLFLFAIFGKECLCYFLENETSTDISCKKEIVIC